MTVFRFILCTACLPMLLCACSDEPEPIRTYKVTKTSDVYAENHVETPEPPARKNARSSKSGRQTPSQRESRMLAAIVVDGNTSWFFKLVGPVDQLAETAGTFAEFIRSVDFADGRPEWTLPSGWKQLPASDPRNVSGGLRRHATLLTGSGNDAPDLAVTRLDIPSGTSHDQWLLMNVNRWRGQMGLPLRKSPQNLYMKSSQPFGSAGSDETRKMTINGGTVVLVHYVGEFQRRSGPPFMNR